MQSVQRRIIIRRIDLEPPQGRAFNDQRQRQDKNQVNQFNRCQDVHSTEENEPNNTVPFFCTTSVLDAYNIASLTPTCTSSIDKHLCW
jgi:hypothetical protein